VTHPSRPPDDGEPINAAPADLQTQIISSDVPSRPPSAIIIDNCRTQFGPIHRITKLCVICDPGLWRDAVMKTRFGSQGGKELYFLRNPSFSDFAFALNVL